MALQLVPKSDPSAGVKYPIVNPFDIDFLEIFPPVGIARVGDSEKEYFLAPEVPRITSPPTNVETFRDNQQKIRRQAVRFRVYAYDTNRKLLGEVNNDNGYTLTWTVRVANKKPASNKFQSRFDPSNEKRNPKVQGSLGIDDRDQLIVDPKEQTIVSGKGPQTIDLNGQFCGSKPENPTMVSIGQLQVDDAGRLAFIGGKGYSRCIIDPSKPQPDLISEFDSEDWVDDVCDGWVNVEVVGPVGSGFSKVSVHKATVISAPPKFAWGLCTPTNLYDIIEDIYRNPENQVEVEFYTHIWPVLLSASTMSWVNDFALVGHGNSGKANFLAPGVIDDLMNTSRSDLKDAIFERLRKPYDDNNPDYNQALTKLMPYLSGDGGDIIDPGQIYDIDRQSDPKRFASITQLQYDRFKKWKDGNFTVGEVPDPTKIKIEDFDLEKQPEYLTRATLEPTIGDPLFPGIETYWIAKLRGTYDFTAKVDPPFRVLHSDPTKSPGHLTKGLSLPWQSDFFLCNTHWWPSARPDVVVTEASYLHAIGGSGTPAQNFAKAVTTRKLWTRGFHNVEYDGRYWPGSTDMVRFWNHLGFVKKPSDIGPLAFVENERLELPTGQRKSD